MKDIKTKITVKNVKSLVKNAELSKNMKDSFVRTKDKTEETQQSSHDTPHAYATDKASENAKKIASITAYKAERFGRKSTKKIYNDIKNFRKNSKAGKAADNTIKTVSKSTIKTTQKSVKTAEQTAKATFCLRNSEMVLWSGFTPSINHITSTLRFVSRSNFLDERTPFS